MATQTQTRESTGLTFDEVWKMFQETDKKFQETAERFQETDKQFQQSKAEHDRMIAETDKKFQETDKKFQETDQELKETGRLVDKLSKNIGGLGNDIGDFAEGLLTSDLLKEFHALGLDFDTTLHNIEINERGTRRPLAELDCLLLDTDIALVIEVKATLTRGNVDQHLNRMKVLSTKDNGLLRGKKLYGAMAGIKASKTTKEYARTKGLFVLEPSGNTVRIEAPVGKPAVW
jgi:Holliday junction resolvase-like predicted endonuclease